MSSKHDILRQAVETSLGERIAKLSGGESELTIEVEKESFLEAALILRDDPSLEFDILIDLCGVDYLDFGHGEWKTNQATDSGFSRGVERPETIVDYSSDFAPDRFAVVVHLLSTTKNQRLRLRCFTGSDNPPIVPSLVHIWASANWFEREAFDMFGILFDGHPDLRRLLTDYGFIGHPFRKDFPLSGNVEVRYDPEKGRVAYQPVSIEPRTLVPKVIREDNRYDDALRGDGENG